MDAGPMINACYRHQHPEVFGRPFIPAEPTYQYIRPATYVVPPYTPPSDNGIQGAIPLRAEETRLAGT